MSSYGSDDIIELPELEHKVYESIQRKDVLLRRMNEWFKHMDWACIDSVTIDYELWEDIKKELGMEE